MTDGKIPWVVAILGLTLLLGVYFDLGGSNMKAPYPMNAIMPAALIFAGAFTAGLAGSFAFKRGVNSDARLRHAALVAGVGCTLMAMPHFL